MSLPIHRRGRERSAAADHRSKRVQARVQHLLKFARSRANPLILTHDNPDPDSLASALALAQLFREGCDRESRIAYGGLVGRAENRAMIRVLHMPVVPLSRVVFDDYDLVCLVDTQPSMGNHSLPLRNPAEVIFDHHPPREELTGPGLAEVGGDYGATSTILVEYLRAAGIVPTPEVATALFYGIKADTRDLGRETGPVDVEAYLYLFPMIDKGWLNEIEYPTLPPDYFRLSHKSMERALVYGDALVVDLGEIYTPDMVAEIADQLLYVEGVRWSLAMATYHDHLHLSLRGRDRRTNAGRLVREVCEPRGGSAGGHGSMAGARIPLPSGARQRSRARRELLERFLEEFGVQEQTPTPLLHLGLDRT